MIFKQVASTRRKTLICLLNNVWIIKIWCFKHHLVSTVGCTKGSHSQIWLFLISWPILNAFFRSYTISKKTVERNRLKMAIIKSISLKLTLIYIYMNFNFITLIMKPLCMWLIMVSHNDKSHYVCIIITPLSNMHRIKHPHVCLIKNKFLCVCVCFVTFTHQP